MENCQEMSYFRYMRVAGCYRIAIGCNFLLYEFQKVQEFTPYPIAPCSFHVPHFLTFPVAEKVRKFTLFLSVNELAQVHSWVPARRPPCGNLSEILKAYEVIRTAVMIATSGR